MKHWTHIPQGKVVEKEARGSDWGHEASGNRRHLTTICSSPQIEIRRGNPNIFES